MRTWPATDGITNRASWVQTITLQDTNPPSITCPAGVTLNCPADTRTNATGVATATDTCSSLSISYSDVTNSGCRSEERRVGKESRSRCSTYHYKRNQTITGKDTN